MDLHSKIITAYTSQSYNECISLINTAPATVSNSSHLRTLKASCLINMEGKCHEAFSILNDIIKEEPSNGLAFYSMGLAHLKEEKLEESIVCFNKAANLDTKGAISKEQVIKLKDDVMKMKAEYTKKSPKVYSSSMELDPPKRSRSNSSNSASKRVLKCNICERVFAQPFSLSRHLLIHTGERPHRCSICNAGFIQKSDLNRHMTTHDDSTNFKCPVCGKKFKTKKNLSCHMLTHSSTRPFKCKVCGKDFRYKRLLRYHEGMHLSAKPYNCDLCGKGFSAKPNLKSHISTHLKRINMKYDGEIELSPPRQLKIYQVTGSFGGNSVPGDSITIQNSSDESESSSEQKKPVKIFKKEPIETTPSPIDFISSSSSSRNGEEISDDIEWNFYFKSLMQDLNRMDEKQKRKFKTKTYALIDEIFE